MPLVATPNSAGHESHSITSSQASRANVLDPAAAPTDRQTFCAPSRASYDSPIAVFDRVSKYPGAREKPGHKSSLRPVDRVAVTPSSHIYPQIPKLVSSKREHDVTCAVAAEPSVGSVGNAPRLLHGTVTETAVVAVAAPDTAGTWSRSGGGWVEYCRGGVSIC
ncbi:hypothetical protein ABW21_db0207910 [Orbilia brochopaga]|nr:hypothetical protein ABW21_db0207910 [Drechslerella brochopaga]